MNMSRNFLLSQPLRKVEVGSTSCNKNVARHSMLNYATVRVTCVATAQQNCKSAIQSHTTFDQNLQCRHRLQFCAGARRAQ